MVKVIVFAHMACTILMPMVDLMFVHARLQIYGWTLAKNAPLELVDMVTSAEHMQTTCMHCLILFGVV